LHLFELPVRSSFDDAEDVVAFVDTIAAAAGRSIKLEMAVEEDAEGPMGTGHQAEGVEPRHVLEDRAAEPQDLALAT
jgi:hypothetical protein